MPNRKWKLGGPHFYSESKEARGNLEFKKDMAEAAKSQKEADELIKNLKIIRATNKLFDHLPEMNKLKKQLKRKNSM